MRTEKPKNQYVFVLALVVIASLVRLSMAEPVEWAVAQGGNGHYYERVDVNEAVTWPAARTQAESRTLNGVPGHLATITSDAENTFIFDNLLDANTNPISDKYYWIGGFLDESWQWVTSEEWSYTNWWVTEPNGDGTALEMASTLAQPAGRWATWNDEPNLNLNQGYIVEYPVPKLPGVYYVDGVNGSDDNNGLSLETAFATIQWAVDKADHADTVLVYPAVYTEPVDFYGKAITVQGVAAANGVPVIQALGNYAVSFYNDEEPNSVLKNFVVRCSLVGVFLSDAFPTLHNLTIIDNHSGVAAYEGAAPDISNCIFYNNADDLFDCEARYSWSTQDINGPNVLNTPLFMDEDANTGDYHLKSERGRYWPEHNVWVLDQVTSPCIDGGDPNCNPGDEPMPNGGRINMGAYGGTPYASMSEWPIPGDINRDGVVNFFDVAIVAQSWLEKLAWVE